ncbi:MAG: hypothetical protein CMB52_03555 [Euryarchaeota archaeon]|nr:hypothetical protein [Euryarchaeota archaeon]
MHFFTYFFIEAASNPDEWFAEYCTPFEWSAIENWARSIQEWCEKLANTQNFQLYIWTNLRQKREII